MENQDNLFDELQQPFDNNILGHSQEYDGILGIPEDVLGQPKKQRKGKAAEVVIPRYGDVEVREDGYALLPYNFLPNMVNMLHDDWFIETYAYFKYFDKSQRDEHGNVVESPDRSRANQANVELWKNLALRIFHTTFKEYGKYHYGLEIGRMAENDGYTFRTKKGSKPADTPDQAMNLLFNEVAPKLIAEDRIAEVVALAWKWINVPCLENNDTWVKRSLEEYFLMHRAKVALSDVRHENKRQHSIAKFFKKYGTQSAVRTFKNKQQEKFGFVIEIGKCKKKNGDYPPLEGGKYWTEHDIQGFISDRIKTLMCRQGGYVFLAKHHDNRFSRGKILSSNLHSAVKKAMSEGCEKSEVIQRLDIMREQVVKGFIEPSDDMNVTGGLVCFPSSSTPAGQTNGSCYHWVGGGDPYHTTHWFGLLFFNN